MVVKKGTNFPYNVKIWVTCLHSQLSLHLDTGGVHLDLDSVSPHAYSVPPAKIHRCINSSLSLLLISPGFTPSDTDLSRPRKYTIVHLWTTILQSTLRTPLSIAHSYLSDQISLIMDHSQCGVWVG